jgi:excisionase family DNA binding protein
MSDSAEFLTATELAAKLKIHPKTAYVWYADGRIPGLRFGRAVRFRLADVLDALGQEGVAR